MRLLVSMLVPALALATVPAAAQSEPKADFLGSATYATAEGCDKLKALAAGGDRNISTVPETLTASGFEGWEHSCSIKSVKPGASNAWQVVTSCSEGESEWDDTYVFEKSGATSFKVKGDGEEEAQVYAVCDAPPVPEGK